MRIRKNSRLIISSSSTASLLVCQLNRSPWDIDSTTQDGSDVGSFTRNGSMGDSSLYSGESMELSFEYMPPQSKQESSSKEAEIGTLDDNNGWVEYGSGLRHSTLSEPTTNTSKKKKTAAPAPGSGPGPGPGPAPGSGTKRRGRPRKVVDSSMMKMTNKYEFYYYSGFGPRWGKKRGEDSTTNKGDNNNNIINDSVINDENSSDDNVSEDEVEINVNNKDDDNGGGGGKKGGYIENVFDEELDYIEDEEEEEEMMYGGGGGRRGRKPIKARSLKSLM